MCAERRHCLTHPLYLYGDNALSMVSVCDFRRKKSISTHTFLALGNAVRTCIVATQFSARKCERIRWQPNVLHTKHSHWKHTHAHTQNVRRQQKGRRNAHTRSMSEIEVRKILQNLLRKKQKQNLILLRAIVCFFFSSAFCSGDAFHWLVFRKNC